jgi:hypothetical protein
MTYQVVIVTGSRSISGAQEAGLRSFLKANVVDAKLVLGDAFGVDDAALCWAIDKNVGYRRFEAEWDRYGNAAGPRRNQQMVDHAISGAKAEDVLCLAFPSITSKGTWDCVKKAAAAGIVTMVVPLESLS